LSHHEEEDYNNPGFVKIFYHDKNHGEKASLTLICEKSEYQTNRYYHQQGANAEEMKDAVVDFLSKVESVVAKTDVNGTCN